MRNERERLREEEIERRKRGRRERKKEEREEREKEGREREKERKVQLCECVRMFKCGLMRYKYRMSILGGLDVIVRIELLVQFMVQFLVA